jgi:hypothetical protein
MGICPTHPGFKEYRSNQLKAVLDEYQVDGIFLDYVHWHAQFETPNPILPETCFCDRCTSAFAAVIDTMIPGNTIPQKAEWILKNADPEWRKWRVGIEFALEGLYWSDIKRWKIGKDIYPVVVRDQVEGIIETKFPNGYLEYYDLLPISLSELSLNEKLVQNPGW